MYIFKCCIYPKSKRAKNEPHYQGKNVGVKLDLLLTWGFKKTIRDHVVKIHSHEYSTNTVIGT